MARPRKQTVDYFPHQCTHGKTMYILEQKYGNDGYAFWFKLLELLGSNESHYLKLENPVDWEFLTAKTRLSGVTCEEILNLLVKLEAIDKEAWEQRIVWSDNFIDGIRDAYRNRKVEIPKKPDCLRKKQDKKRKKSTNEMKLNETKEDDINSSSNVFADDSQELILSDLLRSLILQNNPKAKTPDDLQPWAKEFDKIIRIDKRDPQDIARMIRFSQQHHFWWKNILSAAALRKQYDKLTNEQMSKGGKNDTPQAWDTLREWAEEKEAQEREL